MFSEPLSFNNFLQETKKLLEDKAPNGEVVSSLNLAKQKNIYVPVCQEHYFPISLFLEPAVGDEAAFANYRKNTLHCIKEEYTKKVIELGEEEA